MRVEIALLKVEFGKLANEFGFILYKFAHGFILNEREYGLEMKSK